MKFKENSIVVTKNESFRLKKVKNVFNASTLQQTLIFVVDDKGIEKNISEKDVVKIEGSKSKCLETLIKKIMGIFKKK